MFLIPKKGARMTGQIIDISTDNKHLSVIRGFVCVFEDKKELARFPIDNIEAIIANAHGLSYSNNLLVALAENKIPFVVCGANHSPIAYLLPIKGQYKQGAVMDAQISSSIPLNKSLWKDVIVKKIEMQASVLKNLGKHYINIEEMSKRVKSGDPENLEAQSARLYWQELFGKDFRRDRDKEGINSLLNYGYTILRSTTIRCLISSGLHPTIGIHHKNMLNDARLGDDMMEGFRPFVDMAVYSLVSKGVFVLEKEAKKDLVEVISKYIPSKIGSMQLNICVQNLCISLAKIYLGERKRLDFPLILNELDWTSFNNA